MKIFLKNESEKSIIIQLDNTQLTLIPDSGKYVEAENTKTVLTVYADEKYRTKPVTGKLGLSYFHRFTVQSAYDVTLTDNCTVRFYKETAHGNNLESYIAGKPKKVFMMIGTNDIATSGGLNFSGEQVLQYVKSIVERIHQRSPETKVYLYSILNNKTGNRVEATWLHTNKIVKEYVENAHAKGVILGMSGGKDSFVVASICVQAIGKEKVFGLIMPRGDQKEDVKIAIEECELLGMNYQVADISKLYDQTVELSKQVLKTEELSSVSTLNISPRLRMNLLYSVGGTLG